LTSNDDAAPVAPAGVDTEKPSAARIYDWYLGGTHNWAVDREFGRKMAEQWRWVKPGSLHNREFMNRVVRAALKAGIRQFIDLGSGVPTAGNVHEVVMEELEPGDRATVVYVDYEPVAVAHAELILERHEATGWAGIIQADMRRPKDILRHGETRRLIDFDRPVCLMMMAVLHFAGPHDDPPGLVARYRNALAPGSWFGLSHMSFGGQTGKDADGLRWFVEQYRKTSNPVWMRDREEIEAFFGDWRLLDPGVVHLPDWRPERELRRDEKGARPFAWCGVALRP
jgi:hypothetical protein